MKRLTWGKWLISLVAVLTIILPFVADYNATHIFNPNWSGHSKYHNAQAIMMGTFSGLIALWALWFKRGDSMSGLQFGMLAAAIYWLGMIGAALFPGVAYFDVGSTEKAPIVFGVEITQPYLAAFFIILLLGGYFLEALRQRIAKDQIV